MDALSQIERQHEDMVDDETGTMGLGLSSLPLGELNKSQNTHHAPIGSNFPATMKRLKSYYHF